jgi:ribose transport system ATP-binding protein
LTSVADSDEGQKPAVRILHVSKTFPGTKALTDVSLDILPGEIHALVGQNGSGKSTLIKVLAGFHEPDPGATITVGTNACRFGDPEAAYAAGLRFVHQDLGLVGPLDAVDNLALGLGYTTGRGGRIRWHAQADLTRRALERLGYEIDVRKPISQLLPVEKTAIAIARALQGVREDRDNAVLLVLDEPTATMPGPEVDRLFGIVRRLKEHGIAALYVSHHLEEVFQLADRVTVLRDGRKIATAETATLSRQGLVEMMTGGVVDTAGTHTGARRSTVVLTVDSVSGPRIRDLSFSVTAGEVVGIGGITGSGREEVGTLVFGGIPRNGTVLTESGVLEPNRPDKSVKAGLGFVPADRHRDALVLSMNIRENLSLANPFEYWRRGRLSKATERRAMAELSKELSIKALSLEASVSSLSGGNQQKVVLGRWLRMKPKVLILDEPTQGIDIAAKADVHRLIDQAAREGVGLLVCSSDEDELERLCDRVLVLRKGEVAAEFARPSVSAQRIARASLAEEELVQ